MSNFTSCLFGEDLCFGCLNNNNNNNYKQSFMLMFFLPKSGRVNFLALSFCSSRPQRRAQLSRHSGTPFFSHHAVCTLCKTVIVGEEETWSSWERTNCAPISLWTTQLWNLSGNLRLAAWLLILITSSFVRGSHDNRLLSAFMAHQRHILLTVPAWWWHKVCWRQDRAVLICPFSHVAKHDD